jgi:DNA (cytosine-5)-methyltransferase 1
MTHTEILQSVYNEAVNLVDNLDTEKLEQKLNEEEIRNLDTIISKAESRKAVLTVFITSMTHKIFDSSQDIRFHQDKMKNGYSGRVIDTKEITPFMKKQKFPAMSESGWLTRSLEQNAPYKLDYKGSVSPKKLKEAFLKLLYFVEEEDKDPKKYLKYIFIQLIIMRDKKSIELAEPSNLPISTIIDYIDSHINYRYSTPGASRLPTLAIYSVYECMIEEVNRYNDKHLEELESHTSADSQSGAIGDIEVKNNSDNKVFEGLEIKHGIHIVGQLVEDAYKKFMGKDSVDRYYILSTVKYLKEDEDEIISKIEWVRNIHGCQVIVNGVMESLKYYLRLLDNSSLFISKYVKNMKDDPTIKFEHKKVWNDIVTL